MQATKIEKLKHGVLMALLATMSLFTVSCSSDDDGNDIPTIGDFYVEYAFSGGGYTQEELTQLTAEFNAQLSEINQGLKGISKDAAIYKFDALVKTFKALFSDGASDVVGTLDLSLTLKTVDGKVVKHAVLHITKNGVN